MIPQCASRVRLRARGHRLRRSGDEELATLAAPCGAEVEDPVGALDDVEVMLNDEDGMARVHQALEAVEEATVSASRLLRA